MTQLKFGDINALLRVYKSKPHLKEYEHECDCDHCDHEDTEYVCSVCGHEDRDVAEFGSEGEYKCPECRKSLLSESELRDIIATKKEAYKKK